MAHLQLSGNDELLCDDRDTGSMLAASRLYDDLNSRQRYTPTLARMGFPLGRIAHHETRVEVIMGSTVHWVLVKRLAEITGYSENAVRHKVKSGVWAEGRIWRKAPDGRIFVNLEEFERWVESERQPAAF